MSFFFPSYRCELNTEGPFPGEPDRLWTQYVVEWFGFEFVLRVPRRSRGAETAFAPPEGVFKAPEYGQVCDECAGRVAPGGDA